MPHITIEISQDSLVELQREAQKHQMTPEGRARHLLELFLADTRKFPEGVIRQGCLEIIDAIKPLPGLQKFEWTGFGYRDWTVSFRLDHRDPGAWSTLRTLGAAINSEAAEMGLSARILPYPYAHDDEPMKWAIQSTEPMWPPSELASWLRSQIQ